MKFHRPLAAFLFLTLSLNPGAVFSKAATVNDESNSGSFGYSGLPIVGYDDKSGWLYGGAAFMYSEVGSGINAGLFGVSNLNDFHSFTLNYEQRLGHWLFAFHGLTERAFDNYYGEGDLTSPDNPFRMSIYHFEAKPAILYRPFPHFFIGLFDDYRSRIETDVERLQTPVPGDPKRLFPDESSNAYGLRMDWDTRDKIINTRRGYYFQFLITQGPGDWSLPDQNGFTEVQLDLRKFQPIYPRLVYASRFLGAFTQGNPSYLFRYRLGGLDTLRGYKDNRFRGADFFLVQNELRCFLWKWLSINVSADLGDIGDSKFRQLKLSGQAGLRLGLPPNWGQKMRVDLGYGYDQDTFQIQFGEIF